jgi:hypothetical protein
VACIAQGQSRVAFLSAADLGRAGYWLTRSGTCPERRRRIFAGPSGALMRSTCRGRCLTHWPTRAHPGGSAGGRRDGPRSFRICETAEASDRCSRREPGRPDPEREQHQARQQIADSEPCVIPSGVPASGAPSIWFWALSRVSWPGSWYCCAGDRSPWRIRLYLAL